MPVLVISKFDEDPIKNERAVSRAPNSEGSGPIWPKFELIRDFMPVLVICKYNEDQIKTKGVSIETIFSQLLVNGSFLLPWQPQI